MCCVNISPHTWMGDVRRDDCRQFSETDPARVGRKAVKAQTKESQTQEIPHGADRNPKLRDPWRFELEPSSRQK